VLGVVVGGLADQLGQIVTLAAFLLSERLLD
jgi:hypothetical protein